MADGFLAVIVDSSGMLTKTWAGFESIITFGRVTLLTTSVNPN